MSYAKNIDMAQCEKRFLFRHGQLLPKTLSLLIFKRMSGCLNLPLSVQMTGFPSVRCGAMTRSDPFR